MIGTMTQWLNGFADTKQRTAIRSTLLPVVDRTSTQALNSAGLVITSGGATTAKTGAADFYASVQGTLVKITAGTTLPALTGINAAQNAFVIVCFFVDAAGTRTALGGKPNTVLNKATWPNFPEGKALIGFLLILNAGGVFTGGTTALDTATTVYFNTPGDFDPSVLV